MTDEWMVVRFFFAVELERRMADGWWWNMECDSCKFRA